MGLSRPHELWPRLLCPRVGAACQQGWTPAGPPQKPLLFCAHSAHMGGGQDSEEEHSGALGIPPLPGTHPGSGPSPWSSGLLQVTWHTARPQTRGAGSPIVFRRQSRGVPGSVRKVAPPPALPGCVSATQGAEVSSSRVGAGLGGVRGCPRGARTCQGHLRDAMACAPRWGLGAGHAARRSRGGVPRAALSAGRTGLPPARPPRLSVHVAVVSATLKVAGGEHAARALLGTQAIPSPSLLPGLCRGHSDPR